MGAIQDAASGLIHSTLGAVTAVKHVKAQEEKLKQEKAAEAKRSEEQGLLAEEQYHEAQADILRLTGEQSGAKTELDEATAKASKMKLGGRGNTRAKYQAALSDQEAKQRAFDILTEKIFASKSRIARAKLMMQNRGVNDNGR